MSTVRSCCAARSANPCETSSTCARFALTPTLAPLSGRTDSIPLPSFCTTAASRRISAPPHTLRAHSLTPGTRRGPQRSGAWTRAPRTDRGLGHHRRRRWERYITPPGSPHGASMTLPDRQLTVRVGSSRSPHRASLQAFASGRSRTRTWDLFLIRRERIRAAVGRLRVSGAKSALRARSCGRLRVGSRRLRLPQSFHAWRLPDQRHAPTRAARRCWTMVRRDCFSEVERHG
jgi:hypothetical protein